MPRLQRISHEAQVRGRFVNHGLRGSSICVQANATPYVADASA
jgi:hypothetical protein